MSKRNSNIKTQTKESKVFAPPGSFESFGLDSTLSNQIRRMFRFSIPTLVQAQAIPAVLSGRHVLVYTESSFDKASNAIVYLAPIINHLQGYRPRIEPCHGTFALVLVPTFELCLQLYRILQQLLTYCCWHWIVPGYIQDGENWNQTNIRLRQGISVLIATPRRLLDHLKDNPFPFTNLQWIVIDEADRILELGFGKYIEEILDLLGSKANQSVGKGKSSEFQRQRLILSATLNEKVDHLAKISLENPVMIGIENKKMQPDSSVNQTGFSGSNVNGDLGYSSKFVSSSTGDYKFPAQFGQRFVQDTSFSLGDLMREFNARKKTGERTANESCPSSSPTKKDTSFNLNDLMREFNARKKTGKRPASVSSPSSSPAKKGKAGVCEAEPAFVAGDYGNIAIPAEGVKFSSVPTTQSSAGASCVADVPFNQKTVVPLPKSGKEGAAEELIGYDWVVKHWPISEVEALRQPRSLDTLKSGVTLLAQVFSANLSAIAATKEELFLADGTKQAMEAVSKEKEVLQTKLSVTEQELRIAEDKAQKTRIVNQRLERQLDETMARSREETKKMNQEIAAVQAELERERKEKQELKTKLQKEQLWRDELLQQVDQQCTNYRELALFEVQLKYGPLNLMDIPFEDLRPAPEGFNVFNPHAETLEQQRNRGVGDDSTADIGENFHEVTPVNPTTGVKPAVEDLRPAVEGFNVFNPHAEALEQQRNRGIGDDSTADVGENVGEATPVNPTIGMKPAVEDLRPAPEGFNVFNPPAEALEQQRNIGVGDDSTADVGENVDEATPTTGVKPAVEDLRPAPEGFNVFNPHTEALEQQKNRGVGDDSTADVGKNVDEATHVNPTPGVKPAVEDLRPGNHSTADVGENVDEATHVNPTTGVKPAVEDLSPAVEGFNVFNPPAEASEQQMDRRANEDAIVKVVDEIAAAVPASN